MTDYYGRDTDIDVFFFEEGRVTRDSSWKTKDGHRIQVRNMTNEHLLNTIQILRVLSPYKTDCADERRSAWLNVMANEAYLRGLTLPLLTDEERPAGGRHE